MKHNVKEIRPGMFPEWENWAESVDIDEDYDYSIAKIDYTDNSIRVKCPLESNVEIKMVSYRFKSNVQLSDNKPITWENLTASKKNETDYQARIAMDIAVWLYNAYVKKC